MPNKSRPMISSLSMTRQLGALSVNPRVAKGKCDLPKIGNGFDGSFRAFSLEFTVCEQKYRAENAAHDVRRQVGGARRIGDQTIATHRPRSKSLTYRICSPFCLRIIADIRRHEFQ